jgi:sugar (pentulose or hexulose) kinase
MGKYRLLKVRRKCWQGKSPERDLRPYLEGRRVPPQRPPPHGPAVRKTGRFRDEEDRRDKDAANNGEISCVSADPTSLIRSVLEEVALEHRLLTEKTSRALDTNFERLVFAGGGAKSALRGRIVADVFNLPVYVSDTVESSALGAAESMTHTEKRYEPEPSMVKFHDKLFNRVYKNLCLSVKISVDALDEMSV